MTVRTAAGCDRFGGRELKIKKFAFVWWNEKK
jgi:hypothetical protein